MTLDDLIKEAARDGRFCLTLWPTPEGYQANFSRDRQSWSCNMHADPASALRTALGEKPAAIDLGLFD